MKEIKSLLLINDVQQDELEIFLTSYFGNSQQNNNEISHGEGKLIVKYNNKNKIKSVLMNEGLVSENDLITKSNEALSTNNDIEVQSRFVFSSVIIDGYYRYKNEFQISPVPDNAPKLDSNFIHSDHPFNIEFSFLKSPDLQINSHRSEKKFTEVTLLLNSLLRLGLQIYKNNGVMMWSMDILGSSPKCKYLYKGYFSEEADRRLKDNIGFTSFSDTEKLEEKDANLYYSTRGISSEDYKTFIPNNLRDSLDVYYNLNNDEKEKFLRSSYWLQTAYGTFHTSKSVAYNSLVSSIEVLLSDESSKCSICFKPTSIDICEECKQPNAGPTKKFRDFVEEFAPGVEESLRNELYSIRSEITHGSKLLPGDGPESGQVFNPEKNNSSQKWYLLSQLSRIIQINWLHSMRRSSTVEMLH